MIRSTSLTSAAVSAMLQKTTPIKPRFLAIASALDMP